MLLQAFSDFRQPSKCCLLLIIILSSGCDSRQDTKSMMKNYLTRVARPLGVSSEPLQREQRSPLLDKRILRLSLPEVRLDLFDVLSITHCQSLVQKLAERNSALGKVMAVTHRFLFEIALLDTINECLEHPQTQQKPQLISQLQQWHQQKSIALPNTLWNSIFATDEMLHSLSFSTLPLAPNKPRSEATITALEFFTTQAVLIPDKTANLAPQHLWDQHFAQLNQRRYLGELAQATLLAIQTLDTVSDWLESRESQLPLCPQAKPTPTAKILNTVLKKFYIGEVQPYLARLNQLLVEWQQAMGQLLQQLPAQPHHPAWLQFKAQLIGQPNQPATQFVSFQQATKRHARAWQQLLQQCQLMPQISY